MSIITGGLGGDAQDLLLQGFGHYTIEVIVILKGISEFREPIENLTFKVNGIERNFTKQRRAQVLGKPHLQGWCYAYTIEGRGSAKITMPLTLTIPRPDKRKPDMKFHFVKWHDVESYDRIRTIGIQKDMKPLVVEFQQKAREKGRR